MIFTLSSAMAFAGNKELKPEAEKSAVPVKTENTLSDNETSRLTKRVAEIRTLVKTDMNTKDKKDVRNELREIKKFVDRSGGTIYIGGASLVLIIILLIILL